MYFVRMWLVVCDPPRAVGNKDAFPDRQGTVEPHQQEIKDGIQDSRASHKRELH